MPRYFIRLAFDGTAYHGWQYQPNGITVQKVLLDSLTTALREPVALTGAGRTDTGVHARDYYAHFDLVKQLSAGECSQLLFNLNGLLPKDIAVYELFGVVPEMHARFSALSRTYEYIISQRKDPFLVNRAWFNNQRFDLDMMNRGALLIMEYNNFQCFSKSHTQVKNFRCNIMHASWSSDGYLLRFSIKADRFLRNMVRAIVGTLTELGRGRISPDDLRRIIESGDRRMAGFSVPAEGLYLAGIEYPEKLIQSGIRNELPNCDI